MEGLNRNLTGHTVCMSVQCAAPNCVDHVLSNDACCGRCPNGPNCLLDSRVIAADAAVLESDDRGCTRRCACEDRRHYRGGPPLAVCTEYVCGEDGNDVNGI